MRSVALLFCTIFGLTAVVTGNSGGDVSQAFSTATYQCCINNGWTFMIARSYCSYGAPDPNGQVNTANARAAGIQYTDIYHFPCTSVSASQQVSDDLNTMGGLGNFGQMWFDIETNPSPGCGWSSDTSTNCAFLGSLISAGQGLGIHMGIYASAYMWNTIMGSGCTVGADNSLPLWYAHYDNNPSFSDFSPFGGWSTPAMKQYWDSVGFCGINADADWYPA